MMYRLKKDLGGLKKGTQLQFVSGVFVSGDTSFDPMDVLSDVDHFEEVDAQNVEEEFSLYDTL
ncbi:hypothetical protein IPM62_03680 [Candidatus Woesebacteria bacterium]|nr:MAG: hypothetical protein IPM62_03680 [Candidatus Woesebacteria bacterium]